MAYSRTLPPRGGRKIIHIGVGSEAPFVGERIVDKALRAGHGKANGEERRGELLWRYEALPLMGADRKPAQYVLGADSGEGERFQRAVERGEEHDTSRPHE